MPTEVLGVLLAGGRSHRMGGGDKCLKKLGGQTLLSRVINRVKDQVGPMILNANGDPARFSSYRIPVVPDVVSGFSGPLAGVLTGLEWAAENAPACEYVATFATDAPFLPSDLVEKLQQLINIGAVLACATSNNRHHPVFGLWPVCERSALREAMTEDHIRKVDTWTSHYKLGIADFPVHPMDPFFNLNSPQDLARAEDFLASME